MRSRQLYVWLKYANVRMGAKINGENVRRVASMKD